MLPPLGQVELFHPVRAPARSCPSALIATQTPVSLPALTLGSLELKISGERRVQCIFSRKENRTEMLDDLSWGAGLSELGDSGRAVAGCVVREQQHPASAECSITPGTSRTCLALYGLCIHLMGSLTPVFPGLHGLNDFPLLKR